MWNESEASSQARERMSALLDGELARDDVLLACGHWRESTESRSAWHAYHLIGDVLRSDDLACHPSRDEDFLCSLRARLAQEPVVLAPVAIAHPAVAVQPVQAAYAGDRRRRSWMTPAAVAAGFVAVAGVLIMTRPGPAPSEQLAQAGGASTSVTSSLPSLGDAGQVRPVSATLSPAPAPAPAAEPEPSVANGQLIRDARLDRYLAAHQQFAGSSALGMPSAYLRNTAAEIPGR